MSVSADKYYPHYLSTTQWFNLNTCIQPICRVFGFQVFLVGSVLTNRDWRDVDIRVIHDDYPWPLDTDHNRKVFGMMMSEWLSQRTGLPIDLQIQTRAESDKYMGKRNALGVTI